MTGSPGRRLPRADVSLTAEQLLLRRTFADLFQRWGTGPGRARTMTGRGSDVDLWAELVELGAPLIPVAADAGGGGGELADLALVVEEQGRVLAQVPIVEHAVAARLMAAAGHPASIPGDDGVVTLALAPLAADTLVPGGDLARWVVGVDDGTLVAVELEAEGDRGDPAPGSRSVVPLAPRERWHSVIPLARGDDATRLHRGAVTEWLALTAALLVGVGDAATRLGVDHARSRRAFGVEIGAFQAVSHPLVDAHVAVGAARHLAWTAAWCCDHDGARAPAAAARAWLAATRAATSAGATAIHTLGGVGFSEESMAHVYFDRARTWAAVAGDPAERLDELAAALVGGDR